MQREQAGRPSRVAWDARARSWGILQQADPRSIPVSRRAAMGESARKCGR